VGWNHRGADRRPLPSLFACIFGGQAERGVAARKVLPARRPDVTQPPVLPYEGLPCTEVTIPRTALTAYMTSLIKHVINLYASCPLSRSLGAASHPMMTSCSHR
jgi:hypothetical protein